MRAIRNRSSLARIRQGRSLRCAALLWSLKIIVLRGDRMTLSNAMTPRESPHPMTYLMCPPTHFAVEYAINPWMRAGQPVSAALAMRQWQRLRAAFTGLGHTVHTIDPEPGLPHMVFPANGATVIRRNVLGSRFRDP